MPLEKSSDSILSGKPMLIGVVIALFVGGAAYMIGTTQGYKTGYAQAQTDVKSLQEKTATRAAEETAKSANPFQASNPLQGVETNPFDKVKKVLNPFEGQ